MEISGKIVEMTQEIFSSMIMMEVAQDGDLLNMRVQLEDSISGVIGMAGTHKGVLAIHLPKVVALAITSSFLGMDVEEINEDVEDAVGELANMLGGGVKSILSENGRDINLSMPTTICGSRYDFQATKDSEGFIIPLKCDAGRFFVEMQLEK